MQEKITNHLLKLINKGSNAIKTQFMRSSEINKTIFSDDSLGEESKYSPVKGIIHKYKNRVLWKVSYRCAAHCQFCTRRRQIGDMIGDLTSTDIKSGLLYIDSHPVIDDVILSGGDPFVTPRQTTHILDGLSQIKNVKVIRISTRLPIHLPQSFNSPSIRELLHIISLINQKLPIFIQIHVNHPDELCTDTLNSIKKIKETGVTILSQTVFLREINDDVNVLKELFTSLYRIGILPYYIYRCDYIKGLDKFICPIENEQKIMTELRRQLSGVAIPLYIIDVPGKGKIPVPLNFWDNIDMTFCKDFDGEIIHI